MRLKESIGICAVIVLTFILFHIFIFSKDFKLDTDIISIYIEIINALVIIILTLQVYYYNKKIDDLDFKTKTPLISITQEDNSFDYIIQNIGGGPALNIRILSDLDEANKFWKKNTIGYDLFGNNSFRLDKLNKEQYLITYSDIYDNRYFSYMKNNHLQFGTVKSLNSNKLINQVQEMLNYDREAEYFSIINQPSV